MKKLIFINPQWQGGGEFCADVLAMLQYIKTNCLFAGLGLYEYSPCKAENAFIRSITEAMTE